MKILLHLIILNVFNKVYTELHNNNYNNDYNLNSNEQQNRGTIYYQTYHFPNQLTFSNNVLKQNVINSNQRSRDTENYQIIKLTANEDTFAQNHYTTSSNYVFNTNPTNSPAIEYNIFVVHPQERSLRKSSPTYYFHNELPKSNRLSSSSNTPLIDNRFSTDQTYANTLRSSKKLNNIETKTVDNLNRKENSGQPSVETFQYQYNKGWSVHEATSVDDIVIPHLEDRKYSKYSTPNAPEALYYQKFYNIYNHVEHQVEQDLGRYEMESINDDFNGRSIVAPGQYPHMAAIGFLSNEEKIEFKCGGSLVSKTVVITAAHCCYLNGETPIIVKLGIINLKFQTGNSEPQRRAIKEIIVHPNYNSTMNYHDIALLKLQSPVEFTKFVRPILLWSSDDIPYERVFTMGYGSTSFAKAPTNILTELSLSLIPLEKCKEILTRDEKAPNGVLESQICGRDLERNRDTCQGDSGGPLQLNLEHRKSRNTYRYYLVGIISYGEFCGSKKPGIYTRVSSYCKWIASVVWPNFEM